jgi:hypothetical protein
VVALIVGQNVIRRYSEGTAELIGFYSVNDMTAGDTIQLSSDYVSISCASIMATVGPAAGAAAVAAVSANTTVTIPAGPNHSGGFLSVFGSKVAGA